jgi:hypothetical protein
MTGAADRRHSPRNRRGPAGVCVPNSRASAQTLNPEGGTLTDSDTDAFDANPEPEVAAAPPAGPRRSFGRALAARLRNRGRIARVLALVATVAVIGGAYVVGGPPTATAQADTLADQPAFRAAEMPGATAAPAAVPADGAAFGTPAQGTSQGELSAGGSSDSNSQTAGGQSQLLATIASNQIVKTGEIDLEVSDLDSALNQAQSTVASLGGSVDQSNRSGTDSDATASITFRVPVAKWDDALTALRKIGSKVVSEQTSASDVTSQVIDLNARIDNLKTTETALQSIMARASAVPDVIAVENQLSDTQGQIEELTAQRDNLSNQAAMSTLTVTFALPSKTVTALATQDWTLGSQVDQAGAALVRIGQGLATIAVWIFVVVLPLALAILILLGIWMVGRRLLGRGRRRNAAVGA